MFDLLFTSVIKETVTAQSFAVCSAVSAVLGILIAVFHRLGDRRASPGFFCTLAVLPLIAQTVIMMVSGNLGAGLAVAGAFSLVRFRSVAGTAREICSIFLAMTAGLACGIGYVGIAAAVTLLAEILQWAVFSFAAREEPLRLKICVPDSYNYDGAFDDLFEKYTKRSELLSVRLLHMGAIYRLDYLIVPKKNGAQSALIEELRVRNGNLDIICGKAERDKDEM